MIRSPQGISNCIFDVKRWMWNRYNIMEWPKYIRIRCRAKWIRGHDFFLGYFRWGREFFGQICDGVITSSGKFSTGVMTLFGQIFDGVKTLFSQICNRVMTFWSNLLRGHNFLSQICDGLRDFFLPIWRQINFPKIVKTLKQVCEHGKNVMIWSQAFESNLWNEWPIT